MNTQTIDTNKIQQEKIRQQIAMLVDEFAALEFGPKAFTPEQTTIPPSGKLIGAEELKNMVDASLDWGTAFHSRQD